jgi:exonuclease III
MSDQKLLCNNFQNYFLGTNYAQSNYQGGGVCIYIRADVDFPSTDLSKYFDEKNIEICSLKFLAKMNTLILCIYMAPRGNFEYFINKLDKVLKLLSKTKDEYILCGDFNINFSEESPRKSQLLILLQSYNLYPTVQFPTRITEYFLL